MNARDVAIRDYLETLGRAERAYGARYAHWLTMGAGFGQAKEQAESGRGCDIRAAKRIRVHINEMIGGTR